MFQPHVSVKESPAIRNTRLVDEISQKGKNSFLGRETWTNNRLFLEATSAWEYCVKKEEKRKKHLAHFCESWYGTCLQSSTTVECLTARPHIRPTN